MFSFVDAHIPLHQSELLLQHNSQTCTHVVQPVFDFERIFVWFLLSVSARTLCLSGDMILFVAHFLVRCSTKSTSPIYFCFYFVLKCHRSCCVYFNLAAMTLMQGHRDQRNVTLHTRGVGKIKKILGRWWGRNLLYGGKRGFMEREK